MSTSMAAVSRGRPVMTRRRLIRRSRSFTSARSKICSAGTATATSSQERVATQSEVGSSRVRRVTTSVHGVTPLKSCSRRRRYGCKEGDQARVRPRLGWRERRLEEFSEPETEFLPIKTKAYLYLSGTPFRRWQPVSSSRSRSSTGPTQTSNAPRRSSQPRTPASGTPTARCRRCVFHLSDARRATGDRERWRVR